MLAFTRTLLATSALLISASAFAADDYVILEVGDREIKQSEVETIWQGLFPAGAAPEFDAVEEPIRQNVLRGVASEYLLYNEALSAKADKDEAVLRKIEEAKRKLVVRHYIEEKSDELISEADIKAEYEAMKGKASNEEEVRARHILVDTEDKAKELQAKLKDGADFEKLAKDNSKDPGSKTQGGDLGYFTKGKMVPEFSDAAFELKEGAISNPVKTGFGWHIIKLEDRRKVQPPKFEEAREEIKSKLVEKKLNDYVNRLVDQTDITYYGADGSKRELSKMPDPSKDKRAAAE
jgi:peptidyl-prolyl cis-trans isomerase C